MANVNQKVSLNGITPVGTPPTVFHSGGVGPLATTSGTDVTPSVTETYVAQVFIPANTTLTGISVLNGSAVAGNLTLVLTDSGGVILAKTASTASSGTAAYQKIAFTSTLFVKGPGQYFILVTTDSTSYRFRAHAVGNFPAGKLTGQVYGTLATITVPTTFTADLGPIADTY